MEAKKRIRLTLASPCSADWNSMKGDDAVRHCGSCKKSVYQLSNMSTEQVESLLADTGGNEKCVRFYQRKDGTLLTNDCSVGLRRKRRKQVVVGAGLGVLSALGVAVGATNPSAPATDVAPHSPSIEIHEPERPTPPVEVETEAVPEPPIHDEYEMRMGGISSIEFEIPEHEVDGTIAQLADD